MANRFVVATAVAIGCLFGLTADLRAQPPGGGGGKCASGGGQGQTGSRGGPGVQSPGMNVMQLQSLRTQQQQLAQMQAVRQQVLQQQMQTLQGMAAVQGTATQVYLNGAGAKK